MNSGRERSTIGSGRVDSECFAKLSNHVRILIANSADKAPEGSLVEAKK